MTCRLCGSTCSPFLSLGNQPFPNCFLTEAELTGPESRCPLDLHFCSQCTLVQLDAVVDPADLFTNYLFASSTSPVTRDHFGEMAQTLQSRFHLGPDSQVVEIASNDGVLLHAFRELDVPAIGVEPAENLCQLARALGLTVYNEFFTDETVKTLGSNKMKPVDLVVAANVLAHVPDPLGFVHNVTDLLVEDGVFVAEVQYLADMVDKLTFDNIYLEHLSYFTLESLAALFNRTGLCLYDAERVDTHGGSLRVYANNGLRSETDRFLSMLEDEDKQGLGQLKTYTAFAERVEAVKSRLVTLLAGLPGQIAGFGAPAKATTLLNYCGIGTETIEYIVDDSPLKQGRYLPGMRIPVVGPEVAEADPPDWVVLLAWNYGPQIMEKTRHWGAKYIWPNPPGVVDD